MARHNVVKSEHHTRRIRQLRGTRVGLGGIDLAIPGLPLSVRASALLHGSNEDFVINAYLALQRQWPDKGGFHHYLFLLGQPQASRAAVLREIAASDNARRCGIQFVDDLAAEHQFRPEDHDRARLTELSLALRIGRLVADLEQLRSSVGQLAPERLADAIEAIVQAQQAHQALLESRLNSLVAPAPGTGAGAEPGPGALDDDTPRWQHLARRQLAIEDELGGLKQAVRSIDAELLTLKAALADLHAYATQDLKRQVADYVNALASVQRLPQPAPRANRTLRRIPRAAAAVAAGEVFEVPLVADHA
jgi:hypothetical protein